MNGNKCYGININIHDKYEEQKKEGREYWLNIIDANWIF